MYEPLYRSKERKKSFIAVKERYRNCNVNWSKECYWLQHYIFKKGKKAGEKRDTGSQASAISHPLKEAK